MNQSEKYIWRRARPVIMKIIVAACAIFLGGLAYYYHHLWQNCINK